MNETNQEQELRSERALEELLGKAEPRPLPPKQDEELIRQAVRAEWDQVTGRRVRTRRLTQFALAASVLLAVFASLNALRGPFDVNQLHQLASIDKQFGTVTMLDDGRAVETGTGSGLTLAWNDGGSLRFDENTHIEFESASEIYLRSGRIYFDSMPSGVPSVVSDPDKPKLTIRTDAGSVRHYGTQFMTQFDEGKLRVTVREGRVSVEGSHVNESATVGQMLTVTKSGDSSFEDIEPSGGDWSWVEKTSPSLTLDNRPIIEFLTWVSRETGQPLRIDPSVEQTVNVETMHGVYDGLPSVLLRLHMPTTGLKWSNDTGEIIVGESQ